MNRVANGASAWSEGACTYTYALVAHNQAAHGASAVPSYPPASHFSPFNSPSPSPSNSTSNMGFSFNMDFSGISVGGGMADGALQQQQQVQFDEVDGRGYARLHYAAALGMVEAVQELLARGAAVFTQDNSGNTPLHWAVAYNQFQISTMLITQPNKRIQYFNLIFVILFGLPSFSFIFKTEGSAVNVCNYTGRTALHWACAVGNLQIVTLLIEAGGAMVNVADEDGATPLHAAVAVGDVAIVKYASFFLILFFSTL